MVLLAQMASVALVNARLYQAVQSNEHRLRAVVESSPLAIAEVDMTRGGPVVERGGQHACSAGTTVREAARRVSGDDAAVSILEELWSRTAHGVASVGTDLETTGPNGKTLELSVSTAPLFDHEGAVTGILVVAEDVTERRRMLEQFHQAERLGAMARLAGGVAHDFNNLLTVILGSSEVLLRRADADAEWRDDVAAIQRAGERAAALTSQLLAIGHRRPVQSVVVDPDAVMDSMRPMIVRLLGKDVELVLVPGSAEAPDPGRSGRARAGSAEHGHQRPRRHARGGADRVQHQGHGGRTPRIRGGWWPSWCRTTGPGWIRRRSSTASSPSSPPRAWPGAPASVWPPSTPWSPRPGAHHGGVHRGAGHHLHLVVPGRRCRSRSGAADADAELDRGDEVILLVEDEEELRRLAVRELDRRGYAVVVAAEGAEALEVARSLDGRIDLLVTDVVMPGISGIELAAQVKELWPLMPVLFVSGHLDEGSVGRNPMAEDADLLAKPFTPDQLGQPGAAGPRPVAGPRARGGGRR